MYSRKVVARDPPSIEAHTVLSHFYLARGNLSLAEWASETAAETAPTNSEAQVNLADFLVQLVTNEYPNSLGSASRIFGVIVTLPALVWIVNRNELYLAAFSVRVVSSTRLNQEARSTMARCDGPLN